MKNTLTILFSFFITTFQCKRSCAQSINPHDLFGNWKVKEWMFFEKLNESPYEYKERMKDYRKCLKAQVKIDTNGIHIKGVNFICYFESCDNNFATHPIYLKKKIISDNVYTKEGQGSEMIDSNIVGKHFVYLLDKKYSKPVLILIDAGCKQLYGNFTMKICVVNKNKIGLFMGEELIILERQRLAPKKRL